MKVAVIGIGSMGINHLRVYSELENVEVVGASDMSEDRLQMVASRFSVRTYLDYRELVEKEKQLQETIERYERHIKTLEDRIERLAARAIDKPTRKNTPL